ncbi:MAG: potassium transporter TrkG [Paracoccus sp. (in: a-proteobacteria)]|uniref:potassium transporter TrkG n=1 Tax=Paracoccus sp. TaxID=267 RepID=UPI0026E06E8E|nr:potassium transporter TrkG [Paracoccus sp. (in: a-proteobacteria)]MDO5630731.1 potassium transporter TrkG [Paracoccus sp. (in: a-proteobacteria)]
MAALIRLPLILPIAFIGALAMLVPAAYALTQDQHAIARSFFYAALLFMTLTGMVGLAMQGNPRGSVARNNLLTMLAVMALLPLMLAVPFAASQPDTGLFNAWWEMVSSLTTTGATLYSADLLPAPLHLWRAVVGWMGGLFILIAAIAIMAPLRLGGFELMTSPQDQGLDADHRTRLSSAALQAPRIDPALRVWRAAETVAPVYAALTLVLWVLLLMAGDDALVALCRAMGTLATSGITPVSGPVGQTSGIAGEMAVFLLLIPALSRRFWPGGGELRASDRLRDDPELRIAAGVVTAVALVLLARHFIAVIETGATDERSLLADLARAAGAAWGALFNALSFLTTTGWNSVQWEGARTWSGLTAPGLMLAGLAMFGGGVATTAGGVKLLRVYALARHGEREMQRIIHPRSIAGGGRMARQLRGEGAYLAFLFFMLFATSIAVVVALVSMQRIEFDTATILSIAALTNTGPLAGAIPLTPAFEGTAGIASAPWSGWSGLSPAAKIVLAGAMIVGRLETLAVLALLTPDFWRR